MRNIINEYKVRILYILLYLGFAALTLMLLYSINVVDEKINKLNNNTKVITDRQDTYDNKQDLLRYKLSEASIIHVAKTECDELMLETVNAAFGNTNLSSLPEYDVEYINNVEGERVMIRYTPKELLAYIETNKSLINKFYYVSTVNYVKYCELVYNTEVVWSEDVQEYIFK